MKRKSVALIAILSMMLSITACASKADEASKESNESNESQVVVESSTEEKAETPTITESEAVVETTGAVETTETAETEAPVEIDSRLDVEIIGECVHQDGVQATVFSVTNVSGTLLDLDTTSAHAPDGSFYTNGVSDYYFEDGETLYAWVAGYEETPTTDKIIEALSERCYDGDENMTQDTVVTKETFATDKTEDMENFIDSIVSEEGAPYLMISYQGEKVVEITNHVFIENIPSDADRVEICCMKYVNRQQ